MTFPSLRKPDEAHCSALSRGKSKTISCCRARGVSHYSWLSYTDSLILIWLLSNTMTMSFVGDERGIGNIVEFSGRGGIWMSKIQ